MIIKRVCYLSAFTPKFENGDDLHFSDDQWNVTPSCYLKHFLDAEKMSDTDKKKLNEITKDIIVRDHMIRFLFLQIK